LLLKAVKRVGTKWGAVSRTLSGRTEHSVKNRYNSLKN
jgi:hypothetical protein